MLIIAGTTATSLYIIRSRLRGQVHATLEADLGHSVETFQDLEAGRLVALERENALMAALPSLKALMTTNDPRTIADDAVDFWKTSGNDLFALADADRRVWAAYAQGAANTEILRRDLQTEIADPSKHYLLCDGRLFEYSVRPLYFGSPANGARLGYVISGYAIDRGFLREVGRGAGAEAAFFSGNAVAVSTLSNEKQNSLQEMAGSLQPYGSSAIAMVGRERYLTASKDLTGGAGTPLRLVVMKSFDAADRAEQGDQPVGLLGEPAGNGCRFSVDVVAGTDGNAAFGNAGGWRQGFWRGRQAAFAARGWHAGGAIPEPRIRADAR